MEQITIIKKDGSELPINSINPIRYMKSAVQDSTLMNNDTVRIVIESTDLVEIEVGDKIMIINDVYHIRTTITTEIKSDDMYVYDITFYGVIYELLKSLYRDTNANGVSSKSEFDLTFTLKEFVRVVVYNVNRDYPGKWEFNEANCPDTDPQLMNFSKQNCLNALQAICQKFKYDFHITQEQDIRTINIGSFGRIITPPNNASHFQYGKGNGLFNLKENKVDDKSIISRLWVEGGKQNIKSNYRNFSDRLQLPYPARTNTKSHTLYDGTVIPAGSETIGISSEARRFIEDANLSLRLGGVVEDVEYYDDIFPQRTGEVTTLPSPTEDGEGNIIPADINSFIDNEMFNLTEADVEGNTLYLINGVSAKISFISGKLAGMQFELESYDHETKTFKLLKYTDERGLSFPSSSFPIMVGDKYKITDIVMPQTYINDAEEDLWYAGYNDFLKRKQARVQYEITFTPNFFETNIPDDIEMAIFRPGDYLPIKDDRFGIEKNIRIVSVKRNLLSANKYDYTLTLSDTHSISIINQVIKDVIEHENVIIRNRLRDYTRARLAWRTTEELRNMIFDTDDFFDMGNIRPLSIDTNMLTVGSKSQQFVLNDVILQANVNGLANRFDASAGQLVHLTIDPDQARMWNMSGLSVLLSELGGYYVYAKCARDGDVGIWHVTQQQLKAEDISDPNNYYFQVGIIGSLQDGFTFRDFTTTYGFTRINGSTIITGRIITSDGQCYLDLDGNKFRIGDASSSVDWNVTAQNQVTLKNVKLISGAGDMTDIGVYRGIYDNSATYFPGDEVSYTYNGSTSVYRQKHDIAIQGIPPSNGTYWVVKSSGGVGVGIASITEFYLASALSSGVTHYTTGWKTDPSQAVVSASKKYLWNYELITYTDGNYLNTQPVIIGTYGEDGKGIASITEFYLATNLNTGITHDTPGWKTDPTEALITPTNKYLWNYELIEYTDGTYLNTDPVVIGAYGDKGNGIYHVTEFYLATNLNTGITHDTPGWKTDPVDTPLTAVNKYLWNYESIQYTDGSFVNTQPVIIGTYGEDGKGIASITEFYLATNLNTGITHDTPGWKTDPTEALITPTNKYLWNYELITYTDGDYLNTLPAIIGVYGDSGSDGTAGDYFEYRFAKNGSTVTPPALTNTDANPAGWTISMPATTALEYIWCIMAKKKAAGTLLTNWSNPIRIKGADGATGAKGESPVLVYRGVYGSTLTYYGTNNRVDAVKYGGQYYIARIDAGTITGSLPTDTTKWNTFGAEFESIATNLLLAEGANIGDWFMQGGKIVSTLTTGGNKITLDASMAQILIESLSSGGDYSLDTGNSTLKFNASQGVVEARNSYGVSYISASGIFSNRPRTNALPGTSGYTHYGAIVGLGFGGSINQSWQWGEPDTIITGVYGRSTNSGTAPHYGGYFNRLMINGMFLNTIYIHDGSPSYTTLSDQATFVSGITNSGVSKNVWLPTTGYEGQVVIAKQTGTGKIRFLANSGQLIYDDSSQNSYYDCIDGDMFTFVFVKYDINSIPRQIWTVSRQKIG